MILNLAVSVLLLALYILLAGAVSASELVTGAVLAVLLTSWAMVLRRTSPRRFAFSGGHVRAWMRAARDLPRATAVTARALVLVVAGPRKSPVVTIKRPFRFGSVDDPAERGRRATAVLAASLAPASFLMRAAPGEDVLFHAVDRGRPTGGPEWLA